MGGNDIGLKIMYKYIKAGINQVVFVDLLSRINAEIKEAEKAIFKYEEENQE